MARDQEVAMRTVATAQNRKSPIDNSNTGTVCLQLRAAQTARITHKAVIVNDHKGGTTPMTHAPATSARTTTKNPPATIA